MLLRCWLVANPILCYFLLFFGEVATTDETFRNYPVVQLPLTANGERYLNMTHVQILKERSHNATRDSHVLATLQAASGVYNDKERGRESKLEKTVFITVIAYNANESIYHYKVYFRNFLCFARHYGIDLIVYILHHHLADVESEVQSLERLGVKVLTYPDELFWTLVAEKTTQISWGKKHANFDSTVPSFQSYGALIMLIPQLEILLLGFNVIYFDVDIGLVQDPVPYVTRGDADFTVSIEQRACPEFYPSSRKMAENWEQVEPNTGVMHVRATTQGIAMYRKWLHRIVMTNVKNDQIVFDRDQREVQQDLVNGELVYSELNFTSTFTPKCNWDYKNTSATVRATPIAGTYCFLSEMMFQNGLNSFFCSLKQAFRDDWYVEMVKQVEEVEIERGKSKSYLPVLVHANYCNGKSHELEVRGLWLYNDVAGADNSTEKMRDCKPYNVSNVYFAQMNFSLEAENIKTYREGILRSVLVSGTLLKQYSSDQVYIVSSDLVKLLVPDGDTFLHMGFEWENVRTVPAAVLSMIPDGLPIKSTSLSLLKVKNKNGKTILL
jgi:Nucleotide-diphospho-sugar transferase